MSSWPSSSVERTAVLGAALALLCSGCHHARAPSASASPPPIIALFPLQNLSAGPASTKQLGTRLEVALRDRGLEVVAGDIVERVLARRRIRYTGGLDVDAAKALRDDLGVDAVLIGSIEVYSADYPPKLAITGRLVSTNPEPRILWIEGYARAGDDAPGLLGLGLVSRIEDLEGASVSALAGSLASFALGDGSRRSPCAGAGGFAPRTAFRSPLLDDPDRRSIAVLPFVNESGRRDAGDVLVLEMVRQLVASGRFDVVEPGVVRRDLLGLRVIMEGGVSLDVARVMLDSLHADLLLSGYVRDHIDHRGATGPPKADFTVYVIDRRTGEVVWSSTSRRQGDDGVFFFGRGRVTTTGALVCRMAKGVADRIAGDRRQGASNSGLDSSARSAPRQRGSRASAGSHVESP